MAENRQDVFSLWPQRATWEVNLSRKRVVEQAVVWLTEEEQEDTSSWATGSSATA